MDIGSVGLSQVVDNSLENDLSRELRVERLPEPIPGALALLRVDVIRPKVDDDEVPTLGLARFI